TGATDERESQSSRGAESKGREHARIDALERTEARGDEEGCEAHARPQRFQDDAERERSRKLQRVQDEERFQGPDHPPHEVYGGGQEEASPPEAIEAAQGLRQPLRVTHLLEAGPNEEPADFAEDPGNLYPHES